MAYFSDPVAAFITKLKNGWWNGNRYDTITNPGGMDGGGHVTNFPAALAAVAAVSEAVGQAANAITLAGNAVGADTPANRVLANITGASGPMVAVPLADLLVALGSTAIGRALFAAVDAAAALTALGGTATGRSLFTATDAAAVRALLGGAVTINASRALTAADAGLVLINAAAGAVTVTLPAALPGLTYQIVKTDVSPNAVTISRAGADAINGLTTLSLQRAWEQAVVVGNGTSMWAAGCLARARQSVIILQDQRAQGTPGGTAAANTWQRRVLNTILFDTDALCTLNADKFTLPEGLWEIEVSVPGFYCGAHQARLYDVTAGAVRILGSSANSAQGGGYGMTTISVIHGVINIYSPTTYQVEHVCSLAYANTGLGYSVGAGIEVYTSVRIRRLA